MNVSELHLEESTFTGHLKTQAACSNEKPLNLLIRLHGLISPETKILKYPMILRAFLTGWRGCGMVVSCVA